MNYTNQPVLVIDWLKAHHIPTIPLLHTDTILDLWGNLIIILIVSVVIGYILSCLFIKIFSLKDK